MKFDHFDDEKRIGVSSIIIFTNQAIHIIKIVEQVYGGRIDYKDVKLIDLTQDENFSNVRNLDIHYGEIGTDKVFKFHER